MYQEYFGLNDLPFSIAPNPRYLYLTHQHQEALAHLMYGLGSAGGVILLTGEVGTGKTTISRKLLEDIPEHVDVAWIVNPRLSVEELLASICDELSIPYAASNNSIKIFTDLINAYLIEAHGQGRNVVLMIDEAQNLSPDVLEQLRLLTNLETSERKLLQIILLGQPELKAMLERNDLRQLAQRITARYHLHSLSKEECNEYIRHRLAVAGCNRPVFSNRAINLLFHFSHGTPRLINLICDRALLGIYSCNQSIVTPEHVQQASEEVLGDDVDAPKQALLAPFMMAFVMVIAGAILLYNIGPRLSGESHVDLHKRVQVELKKDKQQQIPLSVVKSSHQQVQKTDSPPAVDDSIVERFTVDRASASQVFTREPVSLFSDKPWQVIEKSGSRLLALQTLAEIWHVKITDEAIEPCEQLAEKKLSCLQQRINVWLLREYNRPAMFQVKADNGQVHYAVIRSIEDDSLTIQLDQQHWNISLTELEQHWQGEFTLLWVKPPGYEQHVRFGDDGAVVQWLARNMDMIQGEMIPPQSFSSMNTMLTERLKSFQASEGLPADGVVGPLTLIRINERINETTPRLTHGDLF